MPLRGYAAPVTGFAAYRTDHLHDLAATQALIEGFHMAYSVAIIGVLTGLVVALLLPSKPRAAQALAASHLATE